MRWYLLKQNKCPKCGGELRRSNIVEVMACQKLDCDFKISMQKFSIIVQDKVERKIDQQAQESQEAEDNYWKNPDF